MAAPVEPGTVASTSYRVLFELGRGGMGAAFLARAPGPKGFDRLVVIKRMNARSLEHPDAVRRFVDEARVTASIHHANVVGVQHVGQDEGGHFLAGLDAEHDRGVQSPICADINGGLGGPVTIGASLEGTGSAGNASLARAAISSGSLIDIAVRWEDPSNIA